MNRFILLLTCLLFAYMHPATAQKSTTFYTFKDTNCKVMVLRGSHFYSCHLLTNATPPDTLLICSAPIDDDVYYEARQIPTDFILHQQKYTNPNQPDLILQFTQDVTLAEGDSGSESEKSKYLQVWNTATKTQLVNHRYYLEEYGWHHKNIELKDGDTDIQTVETSTIKMNYEVQFLPKKIVFKNKLHPKPKNLIFEF